MQRLWAVYQEVVPGGNRRRLDSTRQSCMRRALKARSFEECEHAIRALAKSRWHNGENPQRIKYLDISYALGRKGDSADVIIDRWLEKAPQAGAADEHGPQKLSAFFVANLNAVYRAQAYDRQAMIVRALGSELPQVVEQAQEAREWLRRRLDAEPVIADGKLLGWRRAT